MSGARTVGSGHTSSESGDMVEELLDAGAVLPLGPGDDGSAPNDALTARAYEHPALEGRTVVRLVPEAIGPAEDLALEYLGFTAEGSAPVGRVRRQSLGFPAWALVHDPGNGHHALAVVKEMERLTRLVVTKPGLAKEGFDDIGTRLDRSVPHFLPTFYEQAGRLFLAAEARQQAAVFFGKARAAEQRHALPVDEARLREVFLEFAGAGALSGKALRDHAKALAARLAPAAAFEQFKAVCLGRCAAGLPPYSGMVEDLRRLAKGARLDAAAEERALVTEIIHTGAMNRAAGGFWKAALPALTAVAAEDRTVRERLLALLPTVGGDSPEEFDETWLGVLDRCGAIELLLDGSVPAAEWLSAWAAHRQRGWRPSPRLAAELALVERLAARLVTDRTPVRLLMDGGRRATTGLDLLDLCLAAGVPIEDPAPDAQHLDIGTWLRDTREGRRDLAALTAEPRFTGLLHRGVEHAAGTDEGSAQLKQIAEHPALRTVLADWLTERARELTQPMGLPAIDELLTRMSRFSSASVLAAAPEAVNRMTSFSPAAALARTLRAGILDELGWPALEEALDGLGKVNPMAAGQRHSHLAEDWYRLSDAWPALIVRAGTRVALVGPDRVLEERDLTFPAGRSSRWDVPTVRHVGGQWLVANGHGSDRRAVWSGSPADVFSPVGEMHDNWTALQSASLQLPDGSRTFGGRPVHAGDTSFADERRPVASDGISVWVFHVGRWWDYDPATARRGRVSVPAFFDSALAEAEGPASGRMRLLEHACRLLPVQPGLEHSPFGTRDGLLGWWVRHDQRTGTLTACSVDGSRSPALARPAHDTNRYAVRPVPLPPMRLPAGAVLHACFRAGYDAHIAFHDTEGVLVGQVREGDRGRTYAAGTPVVPPLAHWHALRTRDEAGSAVLRTVTEADARALLAAVSDGAEPVEAVRQSLPLLTHPSLIEGVAGLLAEAARHSRRIRVLAERVERDPRAEPSAQEPVVRHAHDNVLDEALQGFTGSRHFYGSARRSTGSTRTLEQLDVLRRVLAPAATAGTSPLEASSVPWLPLPGAGFAAAAVRAASPTTQERHRVALLELLDAALEVRAADGPDGGPGDAVLLDPRGRLRIAQLRAPRATDGAQLGEVYHAGERRLLLTSCQRVDDTHAYWNGIEYDPAGAFGAWEGFTLVGAEVLGAADDPLRAESVRRLTDLVRDRGPLPYRPEQAREFAERVGVGAVTGALLTLGLPGVNGYGREGLLPAAYLEPLGVKSAHAEAGRQVLAELTPAQRRRFTARLLPSEPDRVTELWAKGHDLEPLTALWLAERGKRLVAPDALVARMVAEVGPGTLLDTVLNPRQASSLTGRTEQRCGDGGLVAADPAALYTSAELVSHLSMLRWLAYRLPYGDPLRTVLPVTLSVIRERLADPGLLLAHDKNWTDENKAVSDLLREVYGLPQFVAVAQAGSSAGSQAGPQSGNASRARRGSTDGLVELSEAIVLGPSRYQGNWESVWVRPSALMAGGSAGESAGGSAAQALQVLAGVTGETAFLRAMHDVLSDEFTALVTADGPAGAAQHPQLAVPDLVAEAAGRFGLSEDGAALYLMLLALPDPTDRSQAEWTGWKPARLKKARAELAATDLVVEAKRARAGRSLFLPGGWLEQKTPRLPVESWKVPLLRWAEDGFVVPDRPLPQVYAEAWGRVTAGDPPAFEEFKGRGGRGGAR
ncbi:hypothetical protein [Streptomyces sp. NPDC003023]|uniref:hypothetical protein n=1 Tax=Streptomyces sp. NPDC003023 TaxID=3364675 RepID=UPI0036BC705C